MIHECLVNELNYSRKNIEVLVSGPQGYEKLIMPSRFAISEDTYRDCLYLLIEVTNFKVELSSSFSLFLPFS